MPDVHAGMNITDHELNEVLDDALTACRSLGLGDLEQPKCWQSSSACAETSSLTDYRDPQAGHARSRSARLSTGGAMATGTCMQVQEAEHPAHEDGDGPAAVPGLPDEADGPNWRSFRIEKLETAVTSCAGRRFVKRTLWERLCSQ